MYKSFSSKNVFGHVLLEREGFFMELIKKVIQQWSKSIAIILFLVVAFFAGNITVFSKSDHPQVLGAKTQITPIPTRTPIPTTVPVTIVNNIIVPTSVPLAISPTPVQLPIVIVVTPTPTPIESGPTISPTEIPIPTVTPTPVSQTITIDVDYAGEHAESIYTTSIAAGESAWQAVQDAIGLANIHYTDYGGSLGIFITGFNGTDANSSQYYDFQVNGISSNVGVSSYTAQDKDTLKFVLTGF